jgi:hypothetical protein
MCIINDYELLNQREKSSCDFASCEAVVTYVPTLHNILKKPVKAKKLFCGKVEKTGVTSKTTNVRGKGFRTILTVERSHFLNIVLKFTNFLFGA